MSISANDSLSFFSMVPKVLIKDQISRTNAIGKCPPFSFR